MLRISIVYTNYKINMLHNQIINCKLNEKNNYIDYININKHHINKILYINNNINEYINDTGEEFYKIGLDCGSDYEKSWELEEFLNELGSSLFIIVPKNSSSHMLKIIIDKKKYYENDNVAGEYLYSKLKIFNHININIHDKYNIFDMIELYKNEKNIS